MVKHEILMDLLHIIYCTRILSISRSQLNQCIVSFVQCG